jgi:hypothetical protein
MCSSYSVTKPNNYSKADMSTSHRFNLHLWQQRFNNLNSGKSQGFKKSEGGRSKAKYRKPKSSFRP